MTKEKIEATCQIEVQIAGNSWLLWQTSNKKTGRFNTATSIYLRYSLHFLFVIIVILRSLLMNIGV